jgi:maltooligosyltrehalose trehalohydrolase
MLFRVWAPAATTVDLLLPPSTAPVPARAGHGGWWSADVPGAGHGTDYWFSVDRRPPRPDPRSPWQPAGVHGPSRVFDASHHRWRSREHPGRDVPGKIFYELHVGTFTAHGTLDAAARRLDDLVDLGIEVVELMPVAAFDGRHGWGYDGVGLYAVHERYGGPEALQRFVDACHLRDLAVCLDVTYNHLGPSGNYLGDFGPYLAARHETPWGPALNLDGPGCAEVRRWVLRNALRWFTDFRVDALRLDAVHALADGTGRHLLAELADDVAELSARLGRPLALIAENDLNDPRTVEPTSAGGHGMTAQWADDVHHAIHALVTGETCGYYADFGSVADLATTLTRVFRHDGGHSTFRGGPWGRPVDPSLHPGHAFLAYTQTHDQVGNRSGGERLAALASPDRCAAAAAIVLTSPFTPMLFMGEEWAASTPWLFFADHVEPLRTLVRNGRRAEMSRLGWAPSLLPDPPPCRAVRRSTLSWEERARGGHARMLAWYRDLIALRRAEPDLRDDDLGAVRVTTGPGPATTGSGWLVVHRGGFDVLVNLTGGPARLPCPDGAVPALAWGPVTPVRGGLRFDGDGAAVVGVRGLPAGPHAGP